MRVSIYTTRSRWELLTGSSTLPTTSRPWSVWARPEFMWCAIISCRSLTGPVPIWLRSDRTAPRYWLTARRRSIRLILRICSRPWEKSPTDLSFPDGSLSAWRALKSCLTCIRTWMRTVSLTIWCIFSRQSSRYVRSMTLRWPYIPMTRHGPYSD